MTEKFKKTDLGPIPEEWGISEFGSILQGGTRNGIYKSKEFHGMGIKIVNMGELFANPRLFSVPMKRIELTEKELELSSLQEGDLLFARRSLVAEGAGKCTIVCEIKEPTTFESSIIRARPNPKKAYSLYLYYFFESVYGQHLLDTIRRQVAVAGITGSDLVKLKIPIPTLNEQKLLSNILNNLDKKIELNRKMNQILEEIGQTIFKHWFINFEFPNEDGKPYKSSGSEMVDSEYGEIPKGWEINPIEKCHCDVNRGFTTKYVEKSDLINLNQKVNRGEYLDKSNYKYYPNDTMVPKDKYASKKDLLINSLGQGTLGRIHLFWENPRNVVVDQHITIIRPDQELITSEYLYFYLTRPENQYRLENEITGSTGMLMLNVSKIRKFPVIVPDINIQKRFSNLISKMYSKKFINVNQSENLAKIRDSLLPRLMSGKIRLKGA